MLHIYETFFGKRSDQETLNMEWVIGKNMLSSSIKPRRNGKGNRKPLRNRKNQKMKKNTIYCRVLKKTDNIHSKVTTKYEYASSSISSSDSD